MISEAEERRQIAEDVAEILDAPAEKGVEPDLTQTEVAEDAEEKKEEASVAA